MTLVVRTMRSNSKTELLFQSSQKTRQLIRSIVRKLGERKKKRLRVEKYQNKTRKVKHPSKVLGKVGEFAMSSRKLQIEFRFVPNPNYKMDEVKERKESLTRKASLYFGGNTFFFLFSNLLLPMFIERSHTTPSKSLTGGPINFFLANIFIVACFKPTSRDVPQENITSPICLNHRIFFLLASINISIKYYQQTTACWQRQKGNTISYRLIRTGLQLTDSYGMDQRGFLIKKE